MPKKKLTKAEIKSHAKSAGIELSQRHLYDFVRYTFPGFKPGWFPEDLCNKLELFFDKLQAGEKPKLIIQSPPRHGKTELVSIRNVCWMLGKDPDMTIISCGYGSDLPERNSRFCHQLIESDLYRDVFPGVELDPKRADMWGVKDRKGIVRSTGIGGGIAGYGADVLIVDDWCKDQQEAISPTTQRRNIDWFRRVAYPRLSPRGGIIIIGTRWHLGDLVGIIREEEGSDWPVVNYPAIAEEDEQHRRQGEPLHPERYNAEALQDIREKIKEDAFQTLYQQRPQPTEGLRVFKEEVLQPFEANVIVPRRGEVVCTGAPEWGSQYAFEEMGIGMLRLWEEPIRGFTYCGAWDVATGEINLDGKRDYHCMGILRRGIVDQVIQAYRINPETHVTLGDYRKPAIVAKWHGNMDSDEYAKLIINLLSWYNLADGLGERNSYGGPLLDILKKTYPEHLLMRELTVGKPRDDVVPTYGFWTGDNSKPNLIEQTVAAYRDQTLIDPDVEGLKEMAHFISNNGKLQAESRYHDDEVIMRGLLVYAHNNLPLDVPEAFRQEQTRRIEEPIPQLRVLEPRRAVRPVMRDPITGY